MSGEPKPRSVYYRAGDADWEAFGAAAARMGMTRGQLAKMLAHAAGHVDKDELIAFVYQVERKGVA